MFKFRRICKSIQILTTKTLEFIYSTHIVHIYHCLFIVSSATSEFLLVRSGDYVVIKNEENCQDKKQQQHDYWIVLILILMQIIFYPV